MSRKTLPFYANATGYASLANYVHSFSMVMPKGKCFISGIITLRMIPMKTSITVVAESSAQQGAIDKICKEFRKEFSGAEVSVKSLSKKLAPEEIVLLIAIQISSEIILKALDRLWAYLSKENIRVNLFSIDKVQGKAEDFLKDKKQIFDFKVIKMEDKGLYVILIYESKKYVHSFHIGKSDLEIIRYEEKNRN